MIRLANKGDVSQILAIYRPYILNTCITFETEVPSEQAFLERFETITARYPWIVWEEKGKILGYAYGDRAFARAAYDWDADLSIYLSEDARGMGLGGKLYGCLEALLARQGYHNLYALVTGDSAQNGGRRTHQRVPRASADRRRTVRRPRCAGAGIHAEDPSGKISEFKEVMPCPPSTGCKRA